MTNLAFSPTSQSVAVAEQPDVELFRQVPWTGDFTAFSRTVCGSAAGHGPYDVEWFTASDNGGWQRCVG